tara:strand:+ start:387 stop:1577 length:1191 start_codon:yes stop_codon:yes gene_type:complete
MNRNEDGKIEVNGLIFNREFWHEKPEVATDPTGGLQYIKTKNDLANKCRGYFMQYKFPNMDEFNEELSHDEKQKLGTDFLTNAGFGTKEISKWPYYSWTIPIKLQTAKDMVREIFKEEMAEEIKEHEESYKLRREYEEDMKNRGILARGIEEFISFKTTFTTRQTAMKNLIESIELSIGRNRFRTLAAKKDGHGNYGYIPEEFRINAFESMAYAKDWLKNFEPIIEELERLEDVLKFPWELSLEHNGIRDEKLQDISLRKLIDFRYQDFLTFLMDFKLRFGKRHGDYNRDGRMLSGWAVANYTYGGEYVREGDASEWDVFNCESNLRYGRYGATWRQWLENKALKGEIEALADPHTLHSIVSRTNHSRHRHNQKYKLYRKPMILVTKSELKEEAEE